MTETSSAKFTIYHNPRCSKSRRTLQLLLDNGIEPVIVRYLETPLTFAELQDVFGKSGLPVTDLLRTHESVFGEVSGDSEIAESDAIRLIVENPILLQRPIVVTDDRAVVGRPPENVLDLL